MIDQLRNALRRDAENIVSGIAQHRYATVTSVDPDAGAVRVTLQPEGVESGWIEDSTHIGVGGVRVVCPLSIGDQVIVGHLHGDSDTPAVVGRIFSAVDRPPTMPSTGRTVRSGEIGIYLSDNQYLHATGRKWLLCGDLVITGNVVASGDVSDGHGALSRLRGNYDAHDHQHSVGPTTRHD